MNKNHYLTLKLLPPNIFASRLTESFTPGCHDHDFVEIFYVTEGQTKHIIDDKEETLTIGNAYLITPKIKHEFIKIEECTHRDFLISTELFKNTCNFINPMLYKKIITKKFLSFKLTDIDISFFENTLNNFLENTNTDNDINYYKMFTLIFINFAYKNINNFCKNHFKMKCIQLIYDNFQYQDAIERIRKELNFNKNYLCKKFKKNFNTTLVDYINKFRMERAKNIIITSDLIISQVAQEVGIESLPYFNKLFCKYYGYTPGKLRTETNPILRKK